MILTKMKSLLIAGATSTFFLASASASYALALTTIPLSSFTLSTGGVTGSSNAALATQTLNNGVGVNSLGNLDSFGNFFSENYLSLGAVGDNTISGSLAATNTSLRLASNDGFVITADDISTTPTIQIIFNYVFRGIGDATASTTPGFSVQLLRFTNPGIDDTFTVAGTFLNRTATGTGVYQFDDRVVAQTSQLDISGFTAGTYGLRVSLNEPNDGGGGDNQAAGFNQFTVQTIPFDFEPSLGIGLLGLGFGLNKVRKNMKAKKNTEV